MYTCLNFMQLSIGDKLGPYEISGFIGRGGMGEVYRGIDTRLGRSVAIKVSAREFSDRFEREARAISALNHPNVCTLYDVGPNYLVMELVEGDPLSTIIAQGPLPLDKALRYAVQIVDALAAAHAKGVIHRDLKPGNIVVTRNGVKVLDFGLAKFGREKSAASGDSSEVVTMTEPITGAGSIVGTLYYMSPEQVEAKEADERSDIFSFGAVVYEMITGKRCFEGETQAGVLAAILKDQPPPMSERQPAVPRSLERVVRKCLEKKPDDRWQSARDLKPTLELIDLDAPAGLSSSGTATTPGRSRIGWLWPGIAAALLVAGAAAYQLWPKAESTGRVTRFEVNLPEGVQINPNVFYIRVSPDGSKLAFTTSGNKAGIWIRDLESVDARLLQGTEGAISPFWSPDGKSVAYGSGNSLMRVDISGGPPQVLCQSAYRVGSGFWTDDNEIVFGPYGSGTLQRVKASGGIPSTLVSLRPSESFVALPSLLPDAKHFLFLGFDSVKGRELYVGSLDAKADQQPRDAVGPARFGVTFVRASNAAGGDLFFVRDGTLMAQPFDAKAARLTGDPQPIVQQIGAGPNHAHFSVTPGGVLAYRTGPGTKAQLTWVDRTGKLQGVIGDPTAPPLPSLSPDEKQVAVFRSDALTNTVGDIWLLDVARNIETRLTTGQTVRVRSDYGVVWSPDGKRLAYAAGTGVYIKDAGGASDAKLVKDLGRPVYVTDWTRDGKFLIYEEPGPGGSSIHALPAEGGDPSAAVTDATPIEGRISSDGRWIAYASSRSNRYEVYVRPFAEPGSAPAPAGPVIQISRDGGSAPKWSGDGTELFFVGITAEVMSAKIELSGGAFRPQAPVSLGIALGSPGWAPAKNGQRFLLSIPLDRGLKTPITVVTNWEAALKQR